MLVPAAGCALRFAHHLKKRPYLLPVAWVQRLVHYAGEKKTGADSSASGSIKLAKERIELMKRYGIMD